MIQKRRNIHLITRICLVSSIQSLARIVNIHVTMLCCVTAYVFVNLSRNQSWVNLLFSVLRDSILDSILDSHRNTKKKKHSFNNSNLSCFEHTVTCANCEYTCNHAVLCYGLCLCKLIEKSIMGESFVFCPARLDP